MQPVHIKNSKTKAKTAALRAQLDKCKICSTRASTRLEGRKQIDNHFKEITVDVSSLARKFEVVLDYASNILGSIESIEERLDALEKSAPNTSTQYGVSF